MMFALNKFPGILTKESDRADVVRQVSVRLMEMGADGRFNGVYLENYIVPSTPNNTPNILPHSPLVTP
jgi:hypothetical protein